MNDVSSSSSASCSSSASYLKSKGVCFKSFSSQPCVVLDDAGSTKTDVANMAAGLPLGVPFSFQSGLFRGTALIRIRGCTPMDNDEETRMKSEEYFRDRKRHLQFVAQGQFNEALSMGELYSGDIYDQPFRPRPPKILARGLQNLFRRLWPGLVVDLTDDQPRLLRLTAGGSQTFRVDKKGSEPDITGRDIDERSENLGPDFQSVADRKRILSNPKLASKYSFDPALVYTFHVYDDVVDLATYRMIIPKLGKLNMTKILNGQVFRLRTMTQEGRDMYNFHVYHKSMLVDGNDDVSSTSHDDDFEAEIKDMAEDLDVKVSC